jgi:hypothetical protein
MENVQELLKAIVPPDKLTVFVPAVAVMVPAPHDPVNPFGVATTKPAGKVSLKATPLRLCVELLFWIVKVRLVEPFNGMLAAPNALMMIGGPTTVRGAVLLVVPVPPSVELIGPVVLFFTPGVVPWTVSEMVQDPLVATDPPDRLAEDAPGVAVAVPPQLLFRLDGFATTTPAGKLSVKAIPFSVTFEFGFVMVKVRLVVPFKGTCATPNALEIVGGLATVRVAEAVLPVPPFVELTAPVVLLKTPDTVPTTVTPNPHRPPTPTVPPVRVIVDGAVVVKVPPHAVDVEVETVTPAGRTSVNATPVSDTVLAAGLVIVKARLDVAPTGMVLGVKDLAIDGGATTLIEAEAVPPVPPSVDVT